MSRRLRRAALYLALALAVPAGRAETMDARPLPVPDSRAAVNPELATDGHGNFLLVWQQGRDYFEQQESDIFALRLDGAGQPVGAPIPVSVEKGSQCSPKVAFAEGMFIVTWHDLRNGRDWDVFAARIGVDGSVRDPGGFLVAGGAANQASPAIAAAFGRAVIVWQHYAGRHYEIHAAVIGGSGKTGLPTPLADGGEKLLGGDLSIVGLGATALLAWKDETKWRAGTVEGLITRNFARLRLNGTKVEVVDTARAPTPALGRDMGRFVGDRAGHALYAAWGDIGRGRRLPVGAAFGTQSAAPLPNPNNEGEQRSSAWDPLRAMALYSGRTQIDGPIAAAYGDGVFLLAAPEAPGAKPPYTARILGTRIASDGRRVNASGAALPLHQSDKPLANPTLAAGPDGFVLVFQQDDGAHGPRLQAKTVR